jgi:hypothetical protein
MLSAFELSSGNLLWSFDLGRYAPANQPNQYVNLGLADAGPSGVVVLVKGHPFTNAGTLLTIDGKTGQVADSQSIPPIPPIVVGAGVVGVAAGGGAVFNGPVPVPPLNQFLQLRQNWLLYSCPVVTNGQVAVESGASVEVYASKAGDGGTATTTPTTKATTAPTTEKAVGK